jgi:hypothetical protein
MLSKIEFSENYLGQEWACIFFGTLLAGKLTLVPFFRYRKCLSRILGFDLLLMLPFSFMVDVVRRSPTGE